MKKKYCEYCGNRHNLEQHHLKRRSQGGGDEPENLITLCRECHTKHHAGHISSEELRWAKDRLPAELPAVKDLFQELVNLRVDEADVLWKQGAIVYVLTEYGVKAGQIASEMNCTARYVGDLRRTFEAFPDEESRVPELTWTHHCIAARTDDPRRWLVEAADRQLSTRELRLLLKGEKIIDELREAEAAWAKVMKILEAGGGAAAWLEAQWDEWRKKKAGEG